MTKKKFRKALAFVNLVVEDFLGPLVRLLNGDVYRFNHFASSGSPMLGHRSGGHMSLDLEHVKRVFRAHDAPLKEKELKPKAFSDIKILGGE